MEESKKVPRGWRAFETADHVLFLTVTEFLQGRMTIARYLVLFSLASCRLSAIDGTFKSIANQPADPFETQLFERTFPPGISHVSWRVIPRADAIWTRWLPIISPQEANLRSHTTSVHSSDLACWITTKLFGLPSHFLLLSSLRLTIRACSHQLPINLGRNHHLFRFSR